MKNIPRNEVLLIQAEQKATGACIHQIGVVRADYKWSVLNANDPSFSMKDRKESAERVKRIEAALQKFVNTGDNRCLWNIHD